MEKQLQTIHPNHGPGNVAQQGDQGERRRGRRGRRGGRDEEKKRKRTEVRRGRRTQAIPNTIQGTTGRRVLNVVTWNLQRIATREQNRARLRRVVNYVKRNNWEIVLISELKASAYGVIWLGEEEDLTVVIHSRKAGIMLRRSMVTR